MARIFTAAWNIEAQCYKIDNGDDQIISHDGVYWVYADTRQPVVSKCLDGAQLNYEGGPRDGDMATGEECFDAAREAEAIEAEQNAVYFRGLGRLGM